MTPIEAKRLMVKARLYRLFALVFAMTGLVVFITLYIQNFSGTFFSTMTQPAVILMLIIPFLPAIVLSLMAGRLEKKVVTLLDSGRETMANADTDKGEKSA